MGELPCLIELFIPCFKDERNDAQGCQHSFARTTMSSLLVLATLRIVYGVYSSVVGAITNLGVLIWDGGLAIYNLVAPTLPANAVVPEGRPGARGVWPAYVPPGAGDSRCSCPALNAMANHGACETLSRHQTSDRTTDFSHRNGQGNRTITSLLFRCLRYIGYPSALPLSCEPMGVARSPET